MSTVHKAIRATNPNISRAKGRREEGTASFIALLREREAIKKIIPRKDQRRRRTPSAIRSRLYRARSRGDTSTESLIELLQKRDAIKKDPSTTRARGARTPV